MEGGSRKEGHRLGAGLAFAERTRGADLPGDPDEIGAACEFQRRVEQRHGVEQRAETEADGDQEQEEAGTDAQHMRNRAHEAEIHTRCEQHHVVRSRRDRCGERKQKQRQQRIGLHGFLRLNWVNIIDLLTGTSRELVTMTN
ncbi:hypothetical protein D9M70_457940 [compost metagenome]